MPSALVWGCNPSYQYETSWIKFLLSDLYLSEFDAHKNFDLISSLSNYDHIFLVESGINRLRKDITHRELALLDEQRQLRLNLSKSFRLTLIHISDEEGKDGDSFYDSLPQSTHIFRNFYHQRFSKLPLPINNFPIGPRDLFLPLLSSSSSIFSSPRDFPWSFMGTIWSSGSRNLSVSTFLHSLPHGFFHGSLSFGQGLPLPEYRSILLNSLCFNSRG